MKIILVNFYTKEDNAIVDENGRVDYVTTEVLDHRPYVYKTRLDVNVGTELSIDRQCHVKKGPKSLKFKVIDFLTVQQLQENNLRLEDLREVL